MPIQKQNLDVAFSEGLDTKTDPKRVKPGKFLSLVNSVFDIMGQLTKRNGFGKLTTLPDGTEPGTITTFLGNLISVSNNVSAYSSSSLQWGDRGYFQPCDLSVQSLVRTAYSQTTVDIAVSQTQAACTVFLDGDGSFKYQVSDITTGQILANVTTLPATTTSPRVFTLGNYFIITFMATVTATPHLRYIAIPFSNLSSPGAPVDISTLVSGLSAGYDAAIGNNSLYLAWDGSDMGGAIRVTRLDRTLSQSGTVAIAGTTADLMSVAIDNTGTLPVLYITAYDSGTQDGYTGVLNSSLVTITAFTKTIDNQEVSHVTSSAQNGVDTIFYEVVNDYASTDPSNYIESVTMEEDGTVGTPAVVSRSVGLASKSFIFNEDIYLLSAYQGQYQPSYFLLDSSGDIVAKLAYSNGAGYPTTQVLSNVWQVGNIFYIGYLLKTLIQPVNKSQNADSVSPVYTQVGVNAVAFDLSGSSIVNTEIGKNLHLAGGILWMYDGVKPVEQNFLLWPEDITATPSTTGGSMADQTYFYQVTYEWTDGQGNLHRSAPSVPLEVAVSGGAGSGSVTLAIPTLRLTYKRTPNNVRIVIYRWSTAQQNFYQVTSITSPTLNNPAVDEISYVDTHTDASILGNSLIYTTGGVVENIAPPGSPLTTLFKSRLFLVDAEDRNLLWYSKVVIEGTPVEMNDAFTLYVAPTTGAQGSTGETTAIAPMDDKLVLFKENAIYYLTGNGPDNLGNNNDYGDPTFVTATVGCTNQKSIAFIPQGLVFQSDKGIWLLGRDLSTNYIGAPVEQFNDSVVVSTQNIPGTNQVRFILDTGQWLMYDYYFHQWGTFQGVPGIGSTLYQGNHTYLSEAGVVFKETPGVYLDNSNPVLMSFISGWFSMAGLQGYQRSYYFNLLGTYYSPHILNLYIGYDYDSAPTQLLQIQPRNFVANWGGEAVWGGTPVTDIPGVAPDFDQQSHWGGPGNIEQWKVNLQRQRCQAFQISMTEQFDARFQYPAGAGLTLSGMNLVVGVKKGFVPKGASQTVG